MAKTESFRLEGTTTKAILLCHTMGDDPSQMKDIGKKLQKQGFTVSCPLYPGHGGTFADMVATEVTDWYDTLEQEFDHLQEQYPDVYVLGMSIGGTFAVHLAQERDVRGLITINAPVIGFDLYSDLYQYTLQEKDKEKIKRYRDHRYHYFRFVTKVGQIENLKKITCPLFVLQGSRDANRYKTSSMMLMTYVTSEVTQRKDYAYSRHLLLLEQDKKQAIKDILAFLTEQESI